MAEEKSPICSDFYDKMVSLLARRNPVRIVLEKNTGKTWPASGEPIIRQTKVRIFPSAGRLVITTNKGKEFWMQEGQVTFREKVSRNMTLRLMKDIMSSS